MTIEEYNTATDIIAKLQTLDNSIYGLKRILHRNDIAEWLMEIRPNATHSLNTIDHKGLLPGFLNTVLSKLCEERAELAKKLEEI
jgi:hypothetical protein